MHSIPLLINRPPQPATPGAVDFGKIPHELRQHDRWVLWRKECRRDGDTPTKIPYCANNLRRASSIDQTTWATYTIVKTALAMHKGKFAGIGFCLGDDAPFFGVDLDSCRDPITGAIVPRAMEIIHRLNTYAEISPSGQGVKMIGVGVMPTVDGTGKNYRKNPWGTGSGGIEMYRRGRFFTITGCHLTGTPVSINPVSAALASLYRELYPPLPARPQPLRNHRLADDNTVRRCSSYLNRLPASVAGAGGHNALLTAACVTLRFGLADGDALDLLRQFNDRALPPWDDRDVVRKLGEAHKLIGNNFGSMVGDRVSHPPSHHPVTAKWRTYAVIGGAA